jgi:HK97 family phage major capsid protein
MKELIKKSKWSGMPGCKFRNALKIKGMAIAILGLFILAFAGSLYATGSGAMQVIGALTLAAPALFVLPPDLDLSEKEQKGYQNLADFLSKRVEELGKELVDSEEIKLAMQKALDAYVKDHGIGEEEYKKLEDALKAQGIEIKSIKEDGRTEGKSLRDVLKEYLTEEKIKSLTSNGKANIEIELKAATTIMTPNASTNAPHALTYEVIPGIHESPIEQPVILLSLNKGNTNSRTLYWINRVNEEGGAAFIAEGELKPLKDWEYQEENSVAKKVAVSTKVSTEMLHDFEYMLSEIRTLLTRSLYQEVDNKLLSGSTVNEPTGILTVAGSYVGTSIDGKILLANNADALRACMLQMRNLNYKPNAVFMNPGDAAEMDLTKSTDGHYIRIELDGIIRGLKVIETTEITAEKFLMMDTSAWIIKILESLRLEFGWENDDFRRNLVTVIAELRLHSYYNSIDAGAFIYESFANVKTAIEKV